MISAYQFLMTLAITLLLKRMMGISSKRIDTTPFTDMVIKENPLKRVICYPIS